MIDELIEEAKEAASHHRPGLFISGERREYRK